MARDKKGFILYADLLDNVHDVDHETLGKLLIHILEYVNDLDPPESNDPVVKFLFRPIKAQLKRDLSKWSKIREKRAEAGRKGGLAKASNAKQSQANLAVTDTVNDTVTVTDTVNVNEKVKENTVSNPSTKVDGGKKKKEGRTSSHSTEADVY